MQGLPANDVTIKSRELLPHVFTFLLPLESEMGSYFLWHYLLFPRTFQHRETRLFTGALLCAVRTFLPD